MKREIDAHTSLYRQAPARCRRTDWLLRQFVEDMRAILRTNPEHEKVRVLMADRGVPLHVQQRVLAGGV
ncbi:hypothetical protein [Pseudothauera rhizosphaerae]|uniref:Uncharacterized protein n=1 Tax=Pseudothauera rhizosphaerae TaxID=2565932 RepID=A0A4S4AMS8_9RHOO|nr:hypothetical protein [Pseudothauera rhizosphaerae]THF60932.1 hypothetical protein E6O51_11935 [Pseudothauera rhizosphaerae]